MVKYVLSIEPFLCPVCTLLTKVKVITQLLLFCVLYTIFALIDHSPVGRIHSEECA